jgi:uncharacterized membrane protein YecN with MAPEG domain
MLTIVPVYAAVFALMFIFLSIRVIGQRRSSRVPIGHSGSALLERRIRVQGNFAEYVPLTLLLLTFVELKAWPAWLLHALALALLAGRIVHAYGVGSIDEDFRFRVTGMAMTFTVMGTAALLLLASVVR